MDRYVSNLVPGAEAGGRSRYRMSWESDLVLYPFCFHPRPDCPAVLGSSAAPDLGVLLNPVAPIGDWCSVARVKGLGWECGGRRAGDVPVNRPRSNDGTALGEADRTRSGRPAQPASLIASATEASWMWRSQGPEIVACVAARECNLEIRCGRGVMIAMVWATWALGTAHI